MGCLKLHNLQFSGNKNTSKWAVIKPKNYYAFGSVMNQRTYTAPSTDYKYGFNGQERDDEVSGEGNSYTAEFWQYDSRLGRRFNLDPEPRFWESYYVCFSNNPFLFNDVRGNTPNPTTNNAKGNRSANKYGRKFNRLTSGKDAMSDEAAHDKLEKNFKYKKWYWIMKKPSDNNDGILSVTQTHHTYFTAQDLYKEKKSKETKISTTNRIPLTPDRIELAPGSKVEGAWFQYFYNIGTEKGKFNFKLESFGGDWTYFIFQTNEAGTRSTEILGETVIVDGDHLDYSRDIKPHDGNILIILVLSPSPTSEGAESGHGFDPNSLVSRLETSYITVPFKPREHYTVMGNNSSRSGATGKVKRRRKGGRLTDEEVDNMILSRKDKK